MKRFLRYLVILVVLAVFMFPVYWLIASAFKSGVDVNAIPPKWLFKPTLDNFTAILKDYGLLNALKNSVVVMLWSVGITVVVGTLAAYGLARYDFKSREGLALDILSIKMLPPIASAIPLYIIANALGLLNTYTVLVLANVLFNLPLVVWVMRIFIEEIPVSIEEAALVDGCAPVKVFFRITAPLMLPGIIATTILCSIFVWNEFMFANILTAYETKTLPVVAAMALQHKNIAWGAACAFGLVLSAPILILVLSVQKYLVRGLTFGVLKD